MDNNDFLFGIELPLPTIVSYPPASIMDYAEVKHDRVEFSFTVPDEFKPTVFIDVPELIAEIISDSLDASSFKRYNPMDAYWMFIGKNYHDKPDVFKHNEIEVQVLNNTIRFSTKEGYVIDDTMDIVGDENNLLAFLDWINDGGVFPFMKESKNNDYNL